MEGRPVMASRTERGRAGQSEPGCGTRGRRRRRGAGGRALKRGKADSQRCEFGGLSPVQHAAEFVAPTRLAPPRDRCPHSPSPHVRSLSRSPFPHDGRITHATVTVAPRAFAPPDRRPAGGGSPPRRDAGEARPPPGAPRAANQTPPPRPPRPPTAASRLRVNSNPLIYMSQFLFYYCFYISPVIR